MGGELAGVKHENESPGARVKREVGVVEEAVEAGLWGVGWGFFA